MYFELKINVISFVKRKQTFKRKKENNEPYWASSLAVFYSVKIIIIIKNKRSLVVKRLTLSEKRKNICRFLQKKNQKIK